MDGKGIDRDLRDCLANNPQDGYTVNDIARVLAVYEGENDCVSWHWILQLNDGRFVYLRGWCDYTGWDCRSNAGSVFTETAELAARECLDMRQEYRDWDDENQRDYPYADRPVVTGQIVYDLLMAQLSTGKTTTWREQLDAEFGVDQGDEL